MAINSETSGEIFLFDRGRKSVGNLLLTFLMLVMKRKTFMNTEI